MVVVLRGLRALIDDRRKEISVVASIYPAFDYLQDPTYNKMNGSCYPNLHLSLIPVQSLPQGAALPDHHGILVRWKGPEAGQAANLGRSEILQICIPPEAVYRI